MKDKVLDNTNTQTTREKVQDVAVYGNPDVWQLLCKASSESEGWMKSTKVMNTPKGCVIQTTTQQKNPDGTYTLTDALVYVPGLNMARNMLLFEV